jgi:general stress protein YciG
MHPSTNEHEAEASSLEPVTTEDGADKHGLAAGGLEESRRGDRSPVPASVGSPGRAPTPRVQGKLVCVATKRDGSSCQAFATMPGQLCHAHSGKANMAEIGRKGGLHSPLTKLRKALSGEEDEHVREQAKDVIKRGMAGDPSVTKLQLDAARSVFSYRAEVPAQERPEAQRQHQGGSFNLLDLFRTCCERGIISQFARPEDQAEVAQLESRLAELLPRHELSSDPPEAA